MIQPPAENFEQRLMRELLSHFEKEIKGLTEKIITDATQQFQNEVRMAVGKVVINLANYYTVERIGGNLVITVRLEGAK